MAIAYELERSTNAAAFTQIYTGGNSFFTDTALALWNTVQYRVRAVDGDTGLTSDWLEGPVFPVRHCFIQVNDNGVIRTLSKTQVNDSGIIRTLLTVQVNDDGIIRQIF